MSRRVYRVRARPLRDSLRALERSGLRLPSFTVAGIRVGLAPSNGKLYVSCGPVYWGEVTASGLFRPSKKIKKKEISMVETILDNPVAAAGVAAELMGVKAVCAICTIPLANEKDRARGIGPKCWEKGLFNTYERRAIAAEQRRVKIEGRGRKARRK